MVTGIPNRQVHLIADQVARVEAHRGLPAVYIGIVAPRTVDPEQLALTLRALLSERGSMVEVGVVNADVDRITLQTLEFAMEEK